MLSYCTDSRAALVVALIPIFALVAFGLHHPSEPILTPDSPSYMYFGESRPVGYATGIQRTYTDLGRAACVRKFTGQRIICHIVPLYEFAIGGWLSPV
jgi:hypothetical protein